MNPNNKRIRRFTAFILAAALLLGSLYGTSSVQAQQAIKATYRGQGYSITLTEQSSWGSDYTAQVDITNTGNSRITNWDILTALKNGAIEDAWNATAEQNETGCLFSCQSYNRTIAAGQTITFGYRAAGSGISTVSKMELTQKKKGSMDSNDYSLSYNIANQWGNQANIELTIYNNTGTTIHNWELTFELNAAIQSIWGATLLQQDNGVVTIDGTGNTPDIKAGQSITIGMSLILDETNHLTPANEQLSCTDGELIREPDGTEESSTTTQEQETTEDDSQQESTTEGNKDSETASGNSKASGDASGEAGTTEEQDITGDIDTGWDDTMIHAGDATVTQWKEQAEGSIKVAILDSGIDYWNDINVVERANFVDSYEDSSLLFDDLSGHGTAAAALLAADPEKWNGSMDNKEEEPEEEEIPEGYENMEEEDIENIDLGMLQSLTAQTISPGISKEEKEACEELKEVIEAIAQQQAEAGQEEEEEETEEESSSTAETVTGKEQTENQGTQTETTASSEAGREELPDASADAKEGEGMEAFANLFNRDGKTVQGVNPNVDIYSARVLDEENEATVTGAIEAIEWAMEKEVQIIQIGFGIQKDNAALHQAIQNAHKKGILIIAPAGNGDSIEYPAAYGEVIAVGSVTSEGKRSSQCASGEALELMAPGEQVCSRGAFGILEPFSGTSMAVPQVTGLATLLWQKDPGQSADCIRKLMDATANSLGEPELYGYGLIDCQEAIGKYHDFVTWYKEQKMEEETGSGDATGEAAETESGSEETMGEAEKTENSSNIEQVQKGNGNSIIEQAQVVVRTALNSVVKGETLDFGNATAGSIGVFAQMKEAVSLKEADEATSVDSNGNPISVAMRESYIKKQFALNNFCKYLKQSCRLDSDSPLIRNIIKQHGGEKQVEEIIQLNWQRFDNDFVKKKIKGWKTLNFKVKSVNFSKTVKNFKVIDVTQSKNNIAENKEYKNKEGYKKKKEIVTINIKDNGNKLTLTEGHTYLIVLKGTKVKKSMLKKAKAARANTVQQGGEEQPCTFVKLFTVGKDPEQAALSSEECTFIGGMVPIELGDEDEVQATVDGGVVEMADTPGHVGKAAANRTVRLYSWDEDFHTKMNDYGEPQPLPAYETTTDAEGYYRFTGVAPGRYNLYMESTSTDMTHYGDITVKIGAGQVHNELIRLVPYEHRGRTVAEGTIRDAATGKGIEGLEVQVFSTGRTHIEETDAGGNYRINLMSAGSYEATVTDPKGRYASTKFTMIMDGKKKENQVQDVFVSRKMEDGQIRIVATWEAGSTAYEGHVVLKNEKKPATDVDLYHKNVHTDYELIKKDGMPYTQIHGDFYSGMGPETFTLYDTSQSFDYYLYHLYEEGDEELKRQMGKIEIYQGGRDKAVATYYVPYQDGCCWKAFHYDTATNTIKPIDKLTKYPDIQEDPDERVNPWKNGWTREAVEWREQE